MFLYFKYLSRLSLSQGLVDCRAHSRCNMMALGMVRTEDMVHYIQSSPPPAVFPEQAATSRCELKASSLRRCPECIAFINVTL